MEEGRRIYAFYLHDIADKVNQYPGIKEDFLHFTDNNQFICFYGWTSRKYIRKEFKSTRDMDLFTERIVDLPTDRAVDEFCDMYGDLLLEKRPYMTKGKTEKDTYVRVPRLVLSTSVESDYVVFNEMMILRDEFSKIGQAAVVSAPLINSSCFNKPMQGILQKFGYDELMMKLFPLEEIPFEETCVAPVFIDHISLYVHLFGNTYKKKD